MTTSLTPCPATPNCVCSDASKALHAIDPLYPMEDLNATWTALQAHLQTLPRVTITRREDAYLATEFRTRVLRFTDDVEFELRPAQGVIAMRSASRVGISDLGANRARLEALREALIALGTVRARP